MFGLKTADAQSGMDMTKEQILKKIAMELDYAVEQSLRSETEETFMFYEGKKNELVWIRKMIENLEEVE